MTDHPTRTARPRRLDPYLPALAGAVALAALFPASGPSARFAGTACDLAVALLFLLYGARLSTRETLAGLRHLRLHGLVLAATFGLFPLLGLATALLTPVPLTGPLQAGVLFLCLVPSTVQSSVALTGAAGGDVPGAICAGTYSSLAGLLLTPLLAAGVLGSHTGPSADGLLRIGAQLLAPFLLGQALRPWLGALLTRHRRVLAPVDRGSILLVVYTAFSAATAQGVWSQATLPALLGLLAVLLALLATVLAATRLGARLLGLDRPAAVAAMLCGSQKSLASGLPMATVLFGPEAGAMVLPLMAYHQLQLLVGTALAAHWARAPATGSPGVRARAALTDRPAPPTPG
ncbi:bile acid:sodium symporter family protein [Kitasatospora sp. SUK 42]|uniref:bile acid:sodium symporter family protein n=1 Tax=Kitasatospora sp. SUK 42 TaxID=1588882 RepID=UPI0018CBA0B1|nr:bile acid:sodium symporter family protein [Kitasatospora sp. SUK 42]MBV2155347.1 bile acid:sodium symporter [Kitasatospora sp. SUK 42]